MLCNNFRVCYFNAFIFYGITIIYLDRKSTRLNSSHLVISYAVFCLKKKKFATNSSDVATLQQATRTIPIAFAAVIDAVSAGFVARLTRPGGNAPGFSPLEYRRPVQ